MCTTVQIAMLVIPVVKINFIKKFNQSIILLITELQ